MLSNSHIINKVVVEVNTNSLKSGNHFKDSFLEYLKEFIFPLLEEKLSDISKKSPSYKIRLPKIEVGITNQTADFEELGKGIITSIDKQVQTAIETALLSSNTSDSQSDQVFISTHKSEEEVLKEFLQSGMVPWWASHDTSTIEKAIASVSVTKEWLQYDKHRERLIKQFSNNDIKKVVQVIVANQKTYSFSRKQKLEIAIEVVYEFLKAKNNVSLNQRFQLWEVLFLEVLKKNTVTNIIPEKIKVLMYSFLKEHTNITKLSDTNKAEQRHIPVEYFEKLETLEVLMNFPKYIEELRAKVEQEAQTTPLVKEPKLEEIRREEQITSKKVVKAENEIKQLLTAINKVQSVIKSTSVEIISDVQIVKECQLVSAWIIKQYPESARGSFKELLKALQTTSEKTSITKEELLNFFKVVKEVCLHDEDRNAEAKLVEERKTSFSIVKEVYSIIKTIVESKNFSKEKKAEELKPEIKREELKQVHTKEREALAELPTIESLAKETQEMVVEIPVTKKNIQELGLDKEVYVSNAGLVLTHPYLKYLLLNTHLYDQEQQKITDPEKAVHLLHYVATQKEQEPESTMLFEKILCGIPAEQPINRFVVLSDEEKKEAENMLKAMLSNWEKMENASLELLRNEFLSRKGKLTVEERKVVLRLEKKPQDILLNKINWNIAMIKLPWLTSMIQVDW